MKSIYKYEIAFGGEHIQMPFGSTILSVKAQNEKVVVYALVNPDEKETEYHQFLVIPTGSRADLTPTDLFLGTVLLYNGEFVLHIFERT